MKIYINCAECFKIQGFPSFEFQKTEMTNDGLLSSTCSKGHTTLTMVQQQKFEILFEIAALALIDGYPRETITSTAAALERFYEYYIRLVCMKKKVNIEQFNELWEKNVNNQSERQFGAFLFTYFFDNNGKIPPLADKLKPEIPDISKKDTKTWTEFRNNIVHKGYIPSLNEATCYMEIIFKYLNELINDIKVNYSQEMQSVTISHLDNLSKKNGNNHVISTMSMSTILNLNENNHLTLKEALENLKQSKKMLSNLDKT